MSDLRRWRLGRADPYALQLAADARLSHTNYFDDQIWEVQLGRADEPAVALISAYGGRVNSARLILAVEVDGRLSLLQQAYHSPPSITAFAPGFAQIEGDVADRISVRLSFWVMESQAVGGRFEIHNRRDSPITVCPQLIAELDAKPYRMPFAFMTLTEELGGLSLGRHPSFEPVLVMEQGRPSVRGNRKKEYFVAGTITIPPGEWKSIRWVHVGLDSKMVSVGRARYWLGLDWDSVFATIAQRTQAIPDIETGDVALDAAISFSGMQLIQAFFRPTEHLPGHSFVSSRQPARGFSKRGDGMDYGRGWDGQSPYAAYHLAQSVTTIQPEFAKALVENYLTAQAADGSIDMKPGLAGQRERLHCPPILARMAWQIYTATRDLIFVQSVYPKLLDFFNRWCEADLDTDRDYIQAWEDVRQTGYVFWPTFAAGQTWSSGVDIRRVESPDLAAYLLSEAEALRHMASLLDNRGAYELEGRTHALLRKLDTMWHDSYGRYCYVDRDTGVTTESETILSDVDGDHEQILAYRLQTAARVVIRVMGGTGRVPKAIMLLEGLDTNGNSVSETVDLEAFDWRYGLGFCTSSHVYSVVDRIRFDGLSQVFKVSAFSMDLTGEDINGYLPLIIGALPRDRAQALIKGLTTGQRWTGESGLTIVPTDDPHFDAASANGGGGTWVYWTSLLCEGLLKHGNGELAVEVLQRLLRTQVAVLRTDKRFPEFYHSDQPLGLGESPYITGIVPVGLLLKVIGIQILDNRRVHIGGPYLWKSPVTVRQHGVTVRRNDKSTEIVFPSGHHQTLIQGSGWNLIEDPISPPAGQDLLHEFLPP